MSYPPTSCASPKLTTTEQVYPIKHLKWLVQRNFLGFFFIRYREILVLSPWQRYFLCYKGLSIPKSSIVLKNLRMLLQSLMLQRYNFTLQHVSRKNNVFIGLSVSNVRNYFVESALLSVMLFDNNHRREFPTRPQKKCYLESLTWMS